MTYKPPPRQACLEISYVVPLGAAGESVCDLFVATWIYRGKIARFSLELRDVTNDRVVLRIDTCHGEVHRHNFDSSGSEVDRHVYVIIPDHGKGVVDDEFNKRYDQIVANWAAYMDGWGA